MDFMQAVRVTRGLFWFALGTAFVISGIIYTIRGALGGFEDEWYAGPIAIVLGFLLGGYFSIFRALRAKRNDNSPSEMNRTETP